MALKKKSIERLYNFFKIVHRLSPKEFNVLVQYLSDEGIHELSQCVKNSICSELVPQKRRKLLKKQLWNNKNEIIYISKKSNAVGKRRKKMPQIGGSMGMIIASVLPILMNLLTKKGSKRT